MYKILIVEDDKGISESICKQLTNWSFIAKGINDFSNVYKEYQDFSPDLVLMDIGLPFYDGYYWCLEIRKESKVPIIFISSTTDNMNIVMTINKGADDFICKPFDIQVLVAKIQALLRRTYNYSNDNELIECNGLVLNVNKTIAHFNDQEINLTKNEYRILLTLLQNKGDVVSREKLMNVLWQTDIYIDENTLTVNINRLRKKLESYGIFAYIMTKTGMGYYIR